MTLTRRAAVVAAVVALAAPALAAAQEPVKSFDQLATRLKPGDRVWVTDAKGREVEGTIQALGPNALTLDAEQPRNFAAGDVSLVRTAKRDSLKNGTLIGLGVGGSLAAAWCIGAAATDDPAISAGVECAEGLIVFGGLGTLIGLAVDAASPGKGAVLYRAPGAAGSPGYARLSVAPMITPRAKGIALALRF